MSTKRKNYSRSRFGLWEYLILALLCTWFVVIVYPMVWTILSSFKNTQELYETMWVLPPVWRFENYKMAWDRGISTYIVNSFVVTGVTIVGVIIISSLCAFGLSRFRFRMMGPILLFCMGGMMLNPQVCLIPLYVLLNDLHIRNTLWALIIPYIAFRLPLIMLLIRSFFLTIPKEIEESARLDGCSWWGVYWRIFLPMSKPILLTGTILTAYYAWNEFMFSIIFIDDSAKRTIPAGLMNFRDALQVDWGPILAGMVISVIPIALLFLFMQKHFIRGMASGSVKG